MGILVSRIASAVFAASILVGISQMGGCDTMISDERVDQALVQVQQQQHDLSEQVAAAATDEERARLNVQLQAANLAAQQLLDIRDKLREAQRTSDNVAGTVQAIGSAIPIPGVNTAIALLGSTGILGGIASWLSRQKYAKVANQIIAGIENAKDPKQNPSTASQLAAALEAAKPWIHSAMDVRTIDAVKKAINTGKL